MTKTHHFKVDNGDMTLVQLESGRTVLVDINIRSAADDDGQDAPDVASQLKSLLSRDKDGRMYVDAFLLTHPDEDHIRGLENHFHLGAPGDWQKKDDRIIIREMWSSPMVFRRRSKNHTLCDDAAAWNKEARRRVQLFRDNNGDASGDRILILGEDEGDKTDDLTAILVKTGTSFGKIDGVTDSTFSARLLAPFPKQETDDDESLLTKNNSSVVLQLTLTAGNDSTAGVYLFGGDAEVGIWEKVWSKYGQTPSRLSYDVLLSPHHCSWHSLSWDSWSDKGKDAKVSQNARSALAQANDGATILTSSKTIKDDKKDPPCIRAKQEYKDILAGVSGEFRCIADHAGDKPLVIEMTANGPKIERAKSSATAAAASGIGSEALPHG